MRIPPSRRFLVERERFALRYTCEHCETWDPDREQCAHGYPAHDHRTARYEAPEVDVVFCKDFQLV